MKHHFEYKESYRHLMAKIVLAQWTTGTTEEIFYVEDQYLFIPDVVVRENGIITKFYEVINKNQFNGKKLGVMQEWCYRNATDVSVFEISADYILDQIDKPDYIRTKEYYNIEFF